jgi:glycosyltransferase involved in cell wall biosynthesis
MGSVDMSSLKKKPGFSERGQEQLRTLHLFRLLDPAVGGPFTYFASLNSALIGTGIDVAVASTNPVACADQAFDVLFEGIGGHGQMRNAAAFWHRLRNEMNNTDIIHIHGVFGLHTMIGAWIGSVYGKPYVISTHGHLHPYALSQKALKKRLYLGSTGYGILARAASMVATTLAEAEAIRALYPRLEVTIIPPGVHVPGEISQQSAENIEAGAPLRICYLGRLHPHKDISLAIRAIARLQKAGRNVILEIIGNGDEDHVCALRNEANVLGVDGLIRFAGFLTGPEKTKAMRRSQLLVLPSRSENFSFAVAEALAIGLPVVVSDQVGLSALVKKYACGAVFPAGNEEALAHALEVLSIPEMRLTAGLRAYRCAKAELSLPGMGRALRDLYYSVAINTV